MTIVGKVNLTFFVKNHIINGDRPTQFENKPWRKPTLSSPYSLLQPSYGFSLRFSPASSMSPTLIQPPTLSFSFYF